MSPPNHLEVAAFSVDPPTLDMLHGLDPESFLIISAIADPLLCIDEDGNVQPALATSWEQVSPVTWRLVLRQNVRFCDGQPLSADDVVATFAEHLAPDRTVLGRSAFSIVKECRKTGPYEIEIETVAPDSMFLRRLCFSHVYSKVLLDRGGRAAVHAAPSACGPYVLERFTPGVEIVLRRNRDHWRAGGAVDTVRIPILRQKHWVAALREGTIDVALGIDVHDKVRLEGEPDIETFSGDAAISHFFLLQHRGPLANLRVRQALNHAVHRQLIVDVAEHGYGRPQTSVATPETFGFAQDIESYAYNPELARRILAEEGYADGFSLRGVVSETSTAVFHTVKEFLARIGVRIDADIMPRSEWMQTVRGPRLRGEGVYDGDFALFVLDNPLLHAVFHQFVFLFSGGDWALNADADYDQRFFQAATSTGADSEPALRALERHVVQNAMLLFTAQAGVHAAARAGVRFPLPKSGHFDSTFWWKLDVVGAALRPRPTTAATRVVAEHAGLEFAQLLSGTSHLGTLYLPSGTTFCKPEAAHVWQNLDATQQRWEAQLKPMLHALVSQAEAKTHLANVLDSTERIAIYGVGDDGRVLFVNEGYLQLVGRNIAPVQALGPLWERIRTHVDADGHWSGPIALLKEDGRRAELYLTTTRARDTQGSAVGYTLVFSDFSGEEERIRNGAIRAILDNVPYGLFRCGRDGLVLSGFSASCERLLPASAGRTIEGASFIELLGASETDASQLRMLYEQLWDDFLPEAINVAQFPQRLSAGNKTLGLSPAPLRDETGAITAVLFSVTDESDRVAAERNQDRLNGVVNVLKHRDPFSSFVREVVGTSDELRASFEANDSAWQIVTRRFLHTCKGVFAQFGLADLARSIHELEDAETLDLSSVEHVRDALRTTLAEHASLWHLRFEDCAPEFTVRATDFESLDAALAAAPTLEAARTVARQWCDHHQRKSVGELVGPMASACSRRAERQGKRVEFILDGADVTLAARHWGLIGTLAHAVNNAIDHGIEAPEDRGEKDPCGRVCMQFAEHQDFVSCRIVDDGRGIDAATVVARAAAAGLVSPDGAAALTRRAALDLIFADGISSRDVVSDAAGRGVGMGALRSAILELGGSVEIESDCGKGTIIELRWPRVPPRALEPTVASRRGRSRSVTGASRAKDFLAAAPLRDS